MANIHRHKYEAKRCLMTDEFVMPSHICDDLVWVPITRRYFLTLKRNGLRVRMDGRESTKGRKPCGKNLR